MITLLYVDDEPILHPLTKTYLEQLGDFRVTTTLSASDALVLISDSPFDAIISDYEMPEMNGIDFLKKIRSSGNTIPFIIFTGRGREEVVIEALNAGADFYIQKGGDVHSQFTELAHKIRQAVQQRVTQTNIRELERRESDILNFLPDATFAIDTRGIVIVWNRAMEKMTGIRSAGILGKGDYEYALPFYHERRPILVDLILKDDPDTAKKYPSIVREEKNLISEIRIPHFNNGDGAFLWFIASPLFNVRGEIIGAIESIRDVTDRERILIDLKESEERYRNVVEDQTEFICRFRPDGTHNFVNDAYCRYFGLSRDALIGHRFVPKIPKEDRKTIDSCMRSLTPEKPVMVVDHRIIMPSGEVRWQRWSDRAIFDEKGNVVEYQSVGRDITETKRIESDLLKKNEEVNAAYEQLTAAEEELRQNYDELNRSQQALQQSEERYRNVVEDQTEFICRFSPEGNLTFVNDAYCRYFGLDRDSCIGLPHTVRIPPEDRGLMQQHLSALTPEHPVAIIEHRIVMPSGEIRWQRWNDRAIYDRDGKIIEYQSVGRDTTDRMVSDEKLKRTNEELAAAYEQMTAVDEELRANFEELSKSQQALQQSEERYRNVVEDQTEFICRFRPDGTHHFVNEAYCRYFGLSREDILNHRFVPQIPEEDTEIVRSHFRSLTQEKPVGWVVHRIIMPDGSVRWHRWNDRAIFTNDGGIAEYLSVGRDITEQKTVELELVKKNEELRLAAAEFNDLYNHAPCGYHSLGPDGRITRINDTELSWLGCSRNDIVGKKTFSGLLTEKSRDAFLQDFTTLMGGGLARGGEAELIRNDGTVLPVLYSITAERDGKGAFVTGNMTLFDNSEQKAAELSIQKANEKLNMLSMITRHDILNQLTGLRAFLELSRPMVHESQALVYLDRVDEAADVIGRQIEFTRYYQNIGIQSPDWRDLAKTIKNSAAQAPLEKIAFKNVAPGLEVYADPLIERVFYNLIDNSLRHGQFVSSIAITAEETDGGMQLVYRDDGIGISPEDKEKLFRKGFGKHSGLGLFLSREILAITGITIRETGEPDKGVQFEILVPKGKYRFLTKLVPG